MNDIQNIEIFNLALAYVFVIMLLLIVKIKGIKKERQIFIASIRMTLQLLIAGYILTYVFEHKHPLSTIFIIGLMEMFAVFTIIKRLKKDSPPAIKKVIIISMLTGTILSIIYFVFIVIEVSPWYEPRYFIPIAGMVIGNSMTGISLGVNKLLNDMVSQKHVVESSLMLGATPYDACRDIVNDSFESAIIPSLNSMLGMGIIFLPGMMTGQILAGITPVTAIKYQIAIMLGITGSVSLTVIVFVQLAYRTFFNKRDQLKI